MTPIMSAWPFSQWGIDIVGPLPIAPGVYHPQANGQVEVTNRDIVKGMERRLGKTHQGWVDELPQVLWAHRTTPKSSNGETPFSLVYGSEVVILIEISIETRRIQDFDAKKNEKRRREDLDILEERRELASIKEAYYKQKLEGYYNKRVRPSTFKPVKKAYGDRAYKLETLSGSRIDQTWNGSNLCHTRALSLQLNVQRGDARLHMSLT
ncbi:reverse transcriptase domain-containing protein [Tanacetum coccineum]